MFKIGFGMSLNWGGRQVLRNHPQSPLRRHMRFPVSWHLLTSRSTQDDSYQESQTSRLVLEAADGMKWGPASKIPHLPSHILR